MLLALGTQSAEDVPMTRPIAHCHIATLVRGLALAMLVTFTLPPNAYASDEPSVFVFLPNDLRARAFEKLLSSAMPGVNITVFGRLKDFQNNIKKSPPDAVLTLRDVLEEQTGISSVLQGSEGGKTQEPYVLVSVDSRANIEGDSVIGVVDILGRKKMPAFVNKVVNTKTKVKRVAKPEDLLSLLQFKMVDAVLIPKASFRSLEAKTELNLVVSDAPGAVFLPALGFLSTNHEAKLSSAVKKLGGEVSKLIRVSSWRAN